MEKLGLKIQYTTKSVFLNSGIKFSNILKQLSSLMFHIPHNSKERKKIRLLFNNGKVVVIVIQFNVGE